METPEGFTKVATGKYTKGDYTYTVNGTTGAVTVSNGAEEPEETEDGTSIAGIYRWLYVYLIEAGTDSAASPDYMKLTVEEDGDFSLESEGSLMGSGTYTFDENTNKITINMEGESPETLDFISLENNNVIVNGDGMIFVSNGVTGIETTLSSEMEGTYTGENGMQAEITNSIITAENSGVNIGREVCKLRYTERRIRSSNKFSKNK